MCLQNLKFIVFVLLNSSPWVLISFQMLQYPFVKMVTSFHSYQVFHVMDLYPYCKVLTLIVNLHIHRHANYFSFYFILNVAYVIFSALSYANINPIN